MNLNHPLSLLAPPEHKPWAEFRSLCGHVRIVYVPSAYATVYSKPWLSYTDGTAGNHFRDLRSTLAHFTRLKYTFPDAAITLADDEREQERAKLRASGYTYSMVD